MLGIIHRWQEKLYREHGTHFIHAGDEWYLLADEAVPEKERYDGYLQLENGVGMLRLLFEEFQDAYEALPGDAEKREVSIATGKLAYPYISELAGRLMEKYPEQRSMSMRSGMISSGRGSRCQGLSQGRIFLPSLKAGSLETRFSSPAIC